jgi:4-hydroxy-3-polyprenylbenzoate decarboxylase
VAFYDLRGFIAEADRRGMLRCIEGAHWDLEIGAIAKMLQDTPANPVLLFDNIPGYPAGFRVLSNHQNNMQKLALVEGFSPDGGPMEIMRQLKEKRRVGVPAIPPREVSDGPVLENCDEGAHVNLLKFPVPRWRALDGGRYIGTGTILINRDPDGGWVNVGTYRQMVHDERTAGFFVEDPHHGKIIARKYWARGQACPVVACYGQEVELFRASTGSSPWGMSELSDLIVGKAQGRQREEEVSASGGVGGRGGGKQGLQFVTVGSLVYELAKQAGLGRTLPTEWFLQDIRD